MNQIKDICYQCNKVQEYNTMQELNQLKFDIYCNECFIDKFNIINEENQLWNQSLYIPIRHTAGLK